MKLNVINLDNQTVGDIELPESIFNLPIRLDILHRVVQWQRAKARSGTHKVKVIGEISGTTKKPFKQKGTGNARQGSLRAPQMRGGAIIFGPVVRSHAYDMPKKVRALGLKTALSSKLADQKLFILDSAKLDEAKTSVLNEKLLAMGLSSVLFIDGNDLDTAFALAVRNLKNIDLLPTMGANTYDILRHENLILTTKAVAQLQERLI
ncbi:50S ribosomal protein L4 [Candidatus Arcanobacter lacustris]|jgi:large subunit ribosomal protein L4|uniref:Large ribosomal subunit protein uL4 n=1 Tax=Candidatus Arcanibacter lacustris TaxID=1607817 RepID=A0A0F5MNL9_9RICK|nr:50S ribosomal protein L4 [Candidatus Arcanobacter lacustris]